MYEAEEKARKALFEYIMLLMREIDHCKEMEKKFPPVPEKGRHLLMERDGNVIENRAYWESIRNEVNKVAVTMAKAYITGFFDGGTINEVYYLAQQCIREEDQEKAKS